MITSASAYNEKCEVTLKRIADGSIDLLLQDTPFGVTQNDWDVVPNLATLWPEWLRIAKPNAAFIFFATQPFASDLINSNRRMFKYDLIWYKALGTGFLNANKMPLRNHEHLLVFYRKMPTYNPQKYVGKMRDKGRKQNTGKSNYGEFKATVTRNDTYHPQSVVDFTNGDNTKESEHPTQKPLDLIRYLVKTYSNPGDTVYDGYLGSGTTAVAAMMEGRHFVGSEMKPEYFEIVQRRLNEIRRTPTLFAQPH